MLSIELLLRSELLGGIHRPCPKTKKTDFWEVVYRMEVLLGFRSFPRCFLSGIVFYSIPKNSGLMRRWTCSECAEWPSHINSFFCHVQKPLAALIAISKIRDLKQTF